MANETVENSNIRDQDAPEADENIPPASLLSDTSTLTSESGSTTLNQNGKGKPQLSGLQSALTPILKYLHIGNKGTSSVPLFSFNNGTAKPNESILSMSHSTAFGGKDNVACSVLNENLPEITVLDVTCDSTVNMTINTQCDSAPCAPCTPIFLKPFKKPEQVLDVNLNSKGCPNPNLTPFCWLHDEILPEMSLLDDTCNYTVHLTQNGSVHSDSAPGTPMCDTEMTTKPVGISEINQKLSATLTPKTDSNSMVSQKETPSFETTHGCTPKKRPSLETSEVFAKTAKLECSEEKKNNTFTGNLTHSFNSGSEVSESVIMEDAKKIQLQVTQEISMSSASDSCKTSSENSGQMGKIIEKTQHVTSDLQPVNTSCPNEINQTFEMTTNETSQSKAGSSNNTFTPVQSSELSSASAQESSLQNKTLDLPTSDSRKPLKAGTPQTNITSKSSPETSLVSNSSDLKSSQSSEIQNHTFEKNSLQQSSGSTIISQAGSSITYLQNTFENKSNQTKDDTETSEKPKDTQEKTTSSPVNKAATTECPLPEISSEKIQSNSDANAKPAEPPENTFEVNPAVEENSKDSPNNGHGLCESIIHANTFTESHKTHFFNLDNTVEFKPDSLIASTPMTTAKAFNLTIERDEGKTAAAQKKLYVDGHSKPVPVTSEAPSNILCDRKTFLPQASAKNHLRMQAPLLLSKFKPASILPKRPELLTSGLPVTRQVEALKANAAPQALQQTTDISNSYNLRPSTIAASALKVPTTGRRKPALSSIPSGIQRPGHGLKPPGAKTFALVSSGSDKPGGANPLAKYSQRKKHPITKIEAPAAKKKKTDLLLPPSNVEASSSDMAAKTKTLKPPTHNQRTLFPRSQKQDTAVPAASSEMNEQTNKVRTLKQLPAMGLKAPTAKPSCHGCTNCSSLEEQLKIKDEEISRLKEELLKCNKKGQPAPL